MRKCLFILTITLFVNTSFGQKFMIDNDDTLLYAKKMMIQPDTLYLSNKTFFPGDTIYQLPCNTYEKINGEIINQTDNHCLRQGHWVLTDSLGNYWKGIYRNSNWVGDWKHFDNEGNLLKIKKEVHLGKDSYLVKEISFEGNVPMVIVEKKFLAFYISNFFIIQAIMFGSFFGRVFINSKIYNIENGTNYSPIYFFAPGYLSNNYHHSLFCTFTFWFVNYKPENRQRVILSHTLAGIALGIFIGAIIGFAISGEI